MTNSFSEHIAIGVSLTVINITGLISLSKSKSVVDVAFVVPNPGTFSGPINAQVAPSQT